MAIDACSLYSLICLLWVIWGIHLVDLRKYILKCVSYTQRMETKSSHRTRTKKCLVRFIEKLYCRLSEDYFLYVAG